MNVASNKDCYGCGVCTSICTKKAINLRLNIDGFYEPLIEDSLCNNCGLCSKVCSFNDDTRTSTIIRSQYAAWSKNEHTRINSTSGGVCFEISRYLINQGYDAILATYNPLTERVEHQLFQDLDSLGASQGSRYLQSFTQEALNQIEKGKKYLFVGTPCQVASLRNLIKIRKIEEDFILVDFFCHGVPSYLLWQKYLNAINEESIKIDDVKWRDKENGWSRSYLLKIKGDKHISSDLQKTFAVFYKLFLGDSCLGKACYDNCKYKGANSCADIRVGDFWGGKFSGSQDGVSCVICLTNKGDSIIKEIDIEMEEQSIEDCLRGQMLSRASRSVNYYKIMRMLKSSSCSIYSISNYLYRQELKKRLWRVVKNPMIILNKMIGK